MRGSRRGIDRERQLRKMLARQGWWTGRAAGSLGDADVIALKAGETPRLIEVKSTAKGPYHSFGPQRRGELEVAAQVAGAEAWLCWWPPRETPMWIPAAMWPSVAVQVTA